MERMVTKRLRQRFESAQTLGDEDTGSMRLCVADSPHVWSNHLPEADLDTRLTLIRRQRCTADLPQCGIHNVGFDVAYQAMQTIARLDLAARS
jgi:hypothetical protein